MRTDISSQAMVLCVLPEASCGQRLSAPQPKGGTYTSPFGTCRYLPLLCTCVSVISRNADMTESASLPVSIHHITEGGDAYGGEIGQQPFEHHRQRREVPGKSAVEQSGYISRTIMYSEYYGETYFPKPAEDLVSTGVLLPDHAPREYLDHSVLWNSVEKVERHAKAQLCRLNKYSLPNWMSYELADKFVQDFIKRNFVSKGMCAEYAIHDSVNEKGERNLHVHILLTMRPILENGEWGEKSRKVYKYDKDGNKIKKKNGRYDCTTEKTTDWDDKGNAKKWRQDLVDSINKVAEEIGIEDVTLEMAIF